MIDRISSHNPSSQQKSSTARKEAMNELNMQVEVKIGDNKSPVEAKEQFYLNEDKLKEIVKGMNDFLNPTHTSLKFELHEKLNEYYVTLIDDRTKEIVREIPPKKLLDFYAAMTEKIGLLVDRKI